MALLSIELSEPFEAIVDFIHNIFVVLYSYSVTIYGVSVPIGVIITSAICMLVFANFAWKGQKG